MQRGCPLVGLTGGIGTGKSTVAALMADQGAIVVDADAIAREVVARGSDGLARLVEEFGSHILQPDGSLDRAQLAAETFGDPAKLAVLNAVTHPLISQRSAEAIAAIPADRIGVYDVALLIENNLHQVCDRVVVVTCPLDVRLERLERRGVVREDALKRISSQLTDQERIRFADIVIDNSGDLSTLEALVTEAMNRLKAELLSSESA